MSPCAVVVTPQCLFAVRCTLPWLPMCEIPLSVLVSLGALLTSEYVCL